MYDLKNLTKLKTLGELAPVAFQGFVAFDEAAFQDGAIPLKYKELMAVAVTLTTQCPYCIDIHAKKARKAVAVTLTTQCPYCIDIHAKKARKAGATEQELAEMTLVAEALRAGGAVTHGTHTLD
jgi:AhpD family alkylhydroperoxidase